MASQSTEAPSLAAPQACFGARRLDTAVRRRGALSYYRGNPTAQRNEDRTRQRSGTRSCRGHCGPARPSAAGGWGRVATMSSARARPRAPARPILLTLRGRIAPLIRKGASSTERRVRPSLAKQACGGGWGGGGKKVLGRCGSEGAAESDPHYAERSDCLDNTRARLFDGQQCRAVVRQTGLWCGK